jgi:hypothetical protein
MVDKCTITINDIGWERRTEQWQPKKKLYLTANNNGLAAQLNRKEIQQLKM